MAHLIALLLVTSLLQIGLLWKTFPPHRCQGFMQLLKLPTSRQDYEFSIVSSWTAPHWPVVHMIFKPIIATIISRVQILSRSTCGCCAYVQALKPKCPFWCSSPWSCTADGHLKIKSLRVPISGVELAQQVQSPDLKPFVNLQLGLGVLALWKRLLCNHLCFVTRT